MEDRILTGLIVYLFCHFLLNVVLSAFAGSTEGIVFKHKIGQVSNNHTIQVTPAGYTFFIWNLIYLWLLAAYIYITVNLFRSSNSTENKQSQATSPVFGKWVSIVLIINSFLYTAWLFIWDNQLMTLSAICLTSIAVTNWIAIVIFSVSLWKNVVVLKAEHPKQLFLNRFLIQNGFATYTAWTTLASLINIAVALVYDGEITDPFPSLLAYSMLSVLLLIWVPLELIFWDNYFRYMITPHFVILWGLCGIAVKQNKFPDGIDYSVSLFSTVLIISILCLTVFRVIITIYRYFKRPLYIGLSPMPNDNQDEHVPL